LNRLSRIASRQSFAIGGSILVVACIARSSACTRSSCGCATCPGNAPTCFAIALALAGLGAWLGRRRLSTVDVGRAPELRAAELKSDRRAWLRGCRAPRAGTEVDNLHAGGLASPVDLTTGELGVAYGTYPRDGAHTHHPDSGVPITGMHLPDFRAAIDLALLAHERFPVPSSVGWDVALIPDGPTLIEGNPMWGADLA
jgi:hypothetical protein